MLGVPVNLAGEGTFNESVDIGTDDAMRAAVDAYRANRNQTIILNGYSQSAPVAMNAAYLIHRDGLIPDDKMTVVLGADSRFPNTGVENVVPSFIPGMYTNGDRDPADTGDIQVISYCVRGDATCGVGNPFAHPYPRSFTSRQASMCTRSSTVTSTTTTKQPVDRREHHVRRLGWRQPLGHDAA